MLLTNDSLPAAILLVSLRSYVVHWEDTPKPSAESNICDSYWLRGGRQMPYPTHASNCGLATITLGVSRALHLQPLDRTR